MDLPSIQMNSSVLIPKKTKYKIRIDSEKPKKTFNRMQSLSFISNKKDADLLQPIKKRQTITFNHNVSKSSINLRGQTSSFLFTEKSRHLLSKLTHLLSEKITTQGSFTIYSKIYTELADYLIEFKDILMVLREGLVKSGIQERKFADFEFKEVLNTKQKELSDLLEKERKDKALMATKLNKLSDEIVSLKVKHKELLIKYEEYEKIIKNDPNKFIEAEKLVEKMMNQCQIINKQQNFIHELQHSESKLKKILEMCEKKGFVVEDAFKQCKNSVLNPGILKAFKKSNTFSEGSKINLEDSI